jgi:acetyl-CoA carboxylase carboxyl transferase subunit alpha
MKDAANAAQAAEALRLTARNALDLGVIDSVLAEPEGGAHRSVDLTAAVLRKQIRTDLAELCAMSPAELRDQRMAKFMNMGAVGRGPDILGDSRH